MIKFNYLLSLSSRITAALAVFGLVLIAACGDDDDKVAVTTVEFANATQNVNENAPNASVISISFDKPASRAGTITVKINEGADTDYATHYTTAPNGSTGEIEISVTKGQTAAQFSLSPVNNALLHDDRTVEFTIDAVSTGFVIGAVKKNTVTIIDDEGPTRANFTLATSQVVENNAESIEITIGLSSPAPAAGSLKVTIASENATYTTNFTTTPAATANVISLPVAVGANSVSFTVTPVDDNVINDTRIIEFTITEGSSSIEIGTTTTKHTLSITDNETPSVAAFSVANGSVNEGKSAGIDVAIALDPATNGTGTLTVEFEGGVYGDDFTTIPEVTDGKIMIQVATEATAVSFKVIPVNDDVITANRVITFTLSASSGVVVLGETGVNYELTINEDDKISTVAEVRELYTGNGATQNITTPLKISGIVTSLNPQTNNNNIWVQDETAGIVVRFTTTNGGSFNRGDKVLVDLTDARFAEFSGLLQVENVLKASATKLTENNTLPAPEVVTIPQFLTDNYQGKLVSIQNVYFVDADGALTMSGTRAISDGVNQTNVRTETGAPFNTSVMPLGSGTVTGLAAINGGAVQIIPMVFAEDVFANNPVGTIGVTQSLTDFGSVDNGAQSASQSYTVQGTTLNKDIVVSASAGFKVSLTEAGTYESSVTILAANANSATTVYVKFVPVSGANQEVEGKITHKSQGAASVSFDVSGTEQGNAVGAGTLMIYEIYGGGGNSGAPYSHDYVVLYNGTAGDIDLSTYSIQYGSAAFTSGYSQANPLGGTIKAGEFFLVQLASQAAVGSALPNPNFIVATTPINLSGTNGNVGLFSKITVHGTTTLVGETTLVDRVAFGTGVAFEGTAAAPAPSNTTSIRRSTFVDTNSNSADFVVISPINLSYLND